MYANNMNSDLLTDQFTFIKFPKSKSPSKEEKREKQAKAWNEMKKRSVARMVKKPRRMTQVRRKGKKTSKIARKRLPSIKSLKTKADNLFSLYVRGRDKKCVMCQTANNLTAGHLIKRGKMATRYDENNVFALCATCNFRDFHDSAYHDRFIQWYINRFGAKRYSCLVDKSWKIKQMKRQDFMDIISKYANTSL